MLGGSRVPHGSQDDPVQQAAVQSLGHLQPCPLDCDRGDQAQHDAQAAEHRKHHGIHGLVKGALLARQRTRKVPGLSMAQPLPPAPALGLPAPPG